MRKYQRISYLTLQLFAQQNQSLITAGLTKTLNQLSEKHKKAKKGTIMKKCFIRLQNRVRDSFIVWAQEVKLQSFKERLYLLKQDEILEIEKVFKIQIDQLNSNNYPYVLRNYYQKKLSWKQQIINKTPHTIRQQSQIRPNNIKWNNIPQIKARQTQIIQNYQESEKKQIIEQEYYAQFSLQHVEQMENYIEALRVKLDEQENIRVEMKIKYDKEKKLYEEKMHSIWNQTLAQQDQTDLKSFSLKSQDLYGK